MNVLIVSQKCENSKTLLKYIESKDALKKIVKIHDINVSGVPKGITRVPTMMIPDGKVIIGGDIKMYLDQFAPDDFEPSSDGKLGFSLNGDADDDSMFSINSYGNSLAPQMTPELEERINMSVEEAMKRVKR